MVKHLWRCVNRMDPTLRNYTQYDDIEVSEGGLMLKIWKLSGKVDVN